MAGMNEQDPRALAMQYQELKKRAEAIQQQLTMVKFSVDDCTKVLKTIEELVNVEEGTEMMFPIGSGSFVYANITSADKVVVDIGSGVSVERPLDDAKQIMEKRKAELEKAYENMNASLAQLSQQMQAIESVISRQQQQAQGQQGQTQQ